MAKAQDVLRIAEGEVGYSRWDDPKPGTKYGRWYESEIDQDDSNYDFGASGVPYCAAFASWVFDQAGAACAGLPGAYCPALLEVAEKAGASVPMMQARPGDVVYFDWNNDGILDLLRYDGGRSYTTLSPGKIDGWHVVDSTGNILGTWYNGEFTPEGAE